MRKLVQLFSLILAIFTTSCSSDDKNRGILPASIEDITYYDDNQTHYQKIKFTFVYNDPKHKDRITHVRYENPGLFEDKVMIYVLEYSDDGNINTIKTAISYPGQEPSDYESRIIKHINKDRIVMYNPELPPHIAIYDSVWIELNDKREITTFKSSYLKTSYIYRSNLLDESISINEGAIYNYKYNNYNAAFKNTSTPQWFLAYLFESVDRNYPLGATTRTLFLSPNKSASTLTYTRFNDPIDYDIDYTSTYKNFPTSATLTWKDPYRDFSITHKTKITYNNEVEE